MDAVKALATLPSLNELRAKIIGLLSGTRRTRIATVISAPAGQTGACYRCAMPRRVSAA